MTQQRKLTDDELQCVKQALIEMGQISGAWDVYSKLRDMVREGTTDGQPCVEPQPLIPDGWRKAVAGDEGRIDRMYWAESLKKWLPATCMPFRADLVFIVPADRVPTDEDAKSRPEVMVRDDAESCWKMRVLVMVLNDREDRFLITDAERSGCSSWKQARHLYPGEKR